MKRLFLTMAIVFSLFTLSSFADDVKVSVPVLKSFKTAFKNASEVNWSITKNIYKANFVTNGQYISAYYDTDGKLIALTRNISSLQLPLSLQSEIRSCYENFWFSDLFEVADEQGTTYYVTLENADSKIILKSESNSSWTTYQKQRKS